MRCTHKEFPAPFRLPFGRWLIPVLGILLCILLLSNTTKGTGIRFGIWMAIGHIIYFSYGFWRSKARLKERRRACENVTEIALTDLAVVVDVPATEIQEKEEIITLRF